MTALWIIAATIGTAALVVGAIDYIALRWVRDTSVDSEDG